MLNKHYGPHRKYNARTYVSFAYETLHALNCGLQEKLVNSETEGRIPRERAVEAHVHWVRPHSRPDLAPGDLRQRPIPSIMELSGAIGVWKLCAPPQVIL